MKGIAYEKYYAMEHRYPSKVEILDRWGYDGKQLHHLLRVEEYLRRYINGEKYADCLQTQIGDFLKAVKKETPHGFYFNLEEARAEAGTALAEVDNMYHEFLSRYPYGESPKDEKVEEILDNVQRRIMKLAILIEMEKSYD